MHEIKLYKPVWKKKNPLSIFLCGENSPGMFCLFKVLHITVSDLRKTCVRKSGSKSLWAVKKKEEKQFLKRRKRIVGIVAVVQSVYNGNNRGLKDRVRADEGQTGWWRPSAPLWILRAEVPHPHQAVTFRGLFLSDFLMISFMRISHFPVCPCERRSTLFLSKGYRQR